MKKEINVFDYAKEITESIGKGVLLTSKADGKVNTMTIGWGTLGIEWAVPVFTVYVREGRYTRELIDKSMEFTVSIPLGDYDSKITGYCGSHTGRNEDKIAKAGLTAVEPEIVGAPGFKELPLTLECKVVYKELQNKNAIDKTLNDKFYPQDVDSSASGANKDYHIAYYGKIVKAYINDTK